MLVKKIITTVILFALLQNFVDAQTAREKAIAEINKAEKDFNDMAATKGIEEAFWYFAAEDAIIKRGNDSLIKGKEGVRHFYAADFFKKATVTWSPDFTDAAESGDMGYTFGKYVWRLKHDDGKVDESRGVFHTVWKRQKDGTWKFVWD